MAKIPGLHVKDEIFAYGGNGQGSINTFVRRFATLVLSIGSAMTYTDSSTLGSFVTVNEAGNYVIEYTDASSAGAAATILRNSNLGTTAGSDPAQDPFRLAAVSVSASGANQPQGIAVPIYLYKGDVIRCQGDTSSTPNGTSNNGTTFRMKKVS